MMVRDTPFYGTHTKTHWPILKDKKLWPGQDLLIFLMGIYLHTKYHLPILKDKEEEEEEEEEEDEKEEEENAKKKKKKLY